MPRTLCLAAVLLAGCASSRLPDAPPPTLDGVNEVLDGRWAIVVLDDASEVRAENVEVGRDHTVYTVRWTSQRDSVPTVRVDHVQLRGASGAGLGASVGASPALTLIGLGFAVASEELADVFIGGGVVLPVPGALLGAAVGAAVHPGDRFAVYRGPLSHYPPAPR